MSVTVRMKNASVIKARLGIQKYGPAHKFFCNECYRYMSKYVPGGTKSHINQSAGLHTDGSGITYYSPDAHYLWNGKLYVDPKYKKGAFYSPDYGYWSRPGITKLPTEKALNYHTPGTGSHWEKLMWTSDGNTVVKNVEKYVRRGCK